VPLEGAAILARECGDEAKRRGVGADVIGRARDFLRRPGISVLPEAELACRAAPVHAMHDPTEGGLVTACWELAQAGEVGVRVNREQIPVLDEGRALCEAFGLDPLGTIASGSLLLAADPDDAGAILGAWRGAGIAGAAIGKVTPAAAGVTLASGAIARPMPSFPQDEISKIFAKA